MFFHRGQQGSLEWAAEGSLCSRDLQRSWEEDAQAANSGFWESSSTPSLCRPGELGSGYTGAHLASRCSMYILCCIWSSSGSDLCNLIQVLEEMESDLGISYPSALPPDERRQYQRDVLSLYKHNQDLNTSLKSHQEELIGAESMLIDLEDEKNWLQEKVDWDIPNFYILEQFMVPLDI